MLNKRKTTSLRLCQFLNSTWLLNIYIIQSNPNEEISLELAKSIIEDKLHSIEQEWMSNEFDYYKTGFAFLHFGNRGVDLTIWHFGTWGSTFETFVCSWYCYGRNVKNMEHLDSAEPIICQYEMELMAKELLTIETIEEYHSQNKFRERFFSVYKN